MKKKKNIVILLVAILLLISMYLVIEYFPKTNNNFFNNPTDNGINSTIYNYTGGTQIVPGMYQEVRYNDITGDYRPIYPGMSKQQYHDFFGNLPEFPSDFFNIARLIYEGRITDYSRISEQYYLQPEFYPAWFSLVNDSYINNDPFMWTPEGYGCYPSIKEVEVPKGSTAVVTTYFRTGFATEAYQGIILRPLLPNVAKNLQGQVIFNQPKNAESYIKVRILNPNNEIYESFKDEITYTNVQDDDWFTILKPTYKRVRDKYGVFIGEQGFPDDWVRVLEIELKISANTPTDTYVISIDVVTPCHAINQEFYFSAVREYYGALYYPSGQFHRSHTPHFQIILHVK